MKMFLSDKIRIIAVNSFWIEATDACCCHEWRASENEEDVGAAEVIEQDGHEGKSSFLSLK